MRRRLAILLPLLVSQIACGDDPASRPADAPPHDSTAAADRRDSIDDTSAAPAPNDDGPAGTDAAAAADVVRRYYDAIAARRYREAWLLWSGDGAASGQSLAAFENGFAETAGVDVDIGAPGRIEGAAGSRYVELPVVVRAVTTDGARQRFEGSYTLRRSVVDGATPGQRAWRIHSATLREIE